MKLEWTELKPEEEELRYYWTKEKGWIEKRVSKKPVYVLRKVGE